MYRLMVVIQDDSTNEPWSVIDYVTLKEDRDYKDIRKALTATENIYKAAVEFNK